jgi:predicted glycosyltransferase
MNILIVTGHPAQVHNFKHVKWELEKKGHKVFWLATNKDISKYLMQYYDIDYTVMSKPGKSVLLKIKTLIKNALYAVKYLKRNKIDIILSRISPQLSLAGFITGTKHFGLTDTETAGVYDKIFSKLLSNVFTSKSFKHQLRKDQIQFDGNIELFYLHPKRFKSLSKKDVASLLGIEENQPYIIMRFVSWDAYHDKGLSGFTDENKLKAVEEFSKYAKVFISAENILSTELEPYKISIQPERMHDVLAYAKMFFGESATMASESAVLGTPAIYLDKYGRGYTDEEGNYGLVLNFRNDINSQLEAIAKGIEQLKNFDLETQLKEKHSQFMDNKIDVTAFMTWFIENYPESKKIMKKNPSYQYQFK